MIKFSEIRLNNQMFPPKDKLPINPNRDLRRKTHKNKSLLGLIQWKKKNRKCLI